VDLVVVPDAGHLLAEEQPDEVARFVVAGALST
jgi:pimeloyl-ACP methyl ester carboxylesterase